jgi:hypothetical protein
MFPKIDSPRKEGQRKGSKEGSRFYEVGFCDENNPPCTRVAT